MFVLLVRKIVLTEPISHIIQVMFVGGGFLSGVLRIISMMEKSLNRNLFHQKYYRREVNVWSLQPNGNMSGDGFYRARYFNLLSCLWEVEPQPIKACLREIREAEGKAIRFIRGYQGAWKAVRVRVE